MNYSSAGWICSLILIASMLWMSCANRSDSSGTTVDSTAIKAAVDSAVAVSKDAASAIDSTVKAAIDSSRADSLKQ
ncbi:hypothetical protein [Flavihumibacter sp. CACIAM 22H1]|uniref:hypothetical protein n=1 Tax=Flavihumibacter sp. CACIAM 22H1 TaxID=1812911 RepID=UPI000AF45846|nr:hypothetical protein [Flavihumibacter sp. CACIAM 22H1]